MYPLYVTIIDKSTKEVVFDTYIGVVVCDEGMESDVQALSIVQSKNEYSLYVPALKVENFFCDRKNKKVKVKQHLQR